MESKQGMLQLGLSMVCVPLGPVGVPRKNQDSLRCHCRATVAADPPSATSIPAALMQRDRCGHQESKQKVLQVRLLIACIPLGPVVVLRTNQAPPRMIS